MNGCLRKMGCWSGIFASSSIIQPDTYKTQPFMASKHYFRTDETALAGILAHIFLGGDDRFFLIYRP
jgi:hypothetical protein